MLHLSVWRSQEIRGASAVQWEWVAMVEKRVAVVEKGAWLVGCVWLVGRWWAAVVEREVLGWWGGTEEGVAGGMVWWRGCVRL